MTLKFKIIAAIVIVLITIVMVVSLFIYIDRLNDKISELNVVISNQDSQIKDLNCQISSLEKNVESFRETINITNEYISNVEKAHSEESAIKQDVYEAIVEDPVASTWYKEQVPQSLLDALLRESDKLSCE